MDKFRKGKINVLFTTDVAARGLDIADVDLVIQMAPPLNIQSYVHRSGRTGRAGKNGTSVCFYAPHLKNRMARIEEEVVSWKKLGSLTLD